VRGTRVENGAREDVIRVGIGPRKPAEKVFEDLKYKIEYAPNETAVNRPS
jgi:hypothetical protein